MRALSHWAPRASVPVIAAIGLAVMPAGAFAARTTFSYTGGEQTYTVPAGVTTVYVTATGARGGGATSGTSLLPGTGAIVSGKITVTAGQTLYVEVGGIGALPHGGFNGGGDGGDQGYISAMGGGGASDVRTVARGLSGSLASRLIVAGGGGGSGYPATSGGNAGQAGNGYPDPAAGGGAGTESAGGAGGCTSDNIGCGYDGSLGQGGTGGFSGSGADAREGTGGGGGLYGGGGGAGVSGALSGAVGGGGGGSSLIPAGGFGILASLSDPPSVVISTKAPKYTAWEQRVYLCVDTPDHPAGTLVSIVSYIDKGDGDVHLENVPEATFPSAAGLRLSETLGGTPYATVTVDQFGAVPTIDLKGSAVPSFTGIPSADLLLVDFLPGFRVASSTCSPATT